MQSISKDDLPEEDIFELEGDTDALVIELVGRGYTTIAAAGGDGTVAAVAAALARTAVPARLAIIPLGTFNHFAKDLGIPLDPRAAFEVARGRTSAFSDIAKVNDTYFINNSSVGAYPFAIQERDAVVRRGIRKMIATAFTFVPSLFRPHTVSLDIEREGGHLRRDAYCVFVGNNRYTLSGSSFGARARLDEGTLYLVFIRSRSRLTLLRMLVASLLYGVLSTKDVDAIGLSSLTIDAHKPLLVSHDGEVSEMRPPLRYSIMPKAVSVAVAV